MLSKLQTGLASEFYVAAELSRLGFDVTVTFGNTKSIDLLVHKDHETYAIQVKGIQNTKSICWNLNKTNCSNAKLLFVLVNLHVNTPNEKPEFFILSQSEALELFNDTPKQGKTRTYLRYKLLKKLKGFENNWIKITAKQNAIL